MSIPDSYHPVIDKMLVGLVNIIMIIHMAASIIVFTKNLISVIKKKCKKKIVPIENDIKSLDQAKACVSLNQGEFVIHDIEHINLNEIRATTKE